MPAPSHARSPTSETARCYSGRSRLSGPTSRCLTTWTNWNGAALSPDLRRWGHDSTPPSLATGGTWAVDRRSAPIFAVDWTNWKLHSATSRQSVGVKGQQEYYHSDAINSFGATLALYE